MRFFVEISKSILSIVIVNLFFRNQRRSHHCFPYICLAIKGLYYPATANIFHLNTFHDGIFQFFRNQCQSHLPALTSTCYSNKVKNACPSFSISFFEQCSNAISVPKKKIEKSEHIYYLNFTKITSQGKSFSALFMGKKVWLQS